MGSLAEVVTRLRPLNVLVDRSRDGTLPDTLRNLQPHGVFRTTEGFRRLTRNALRRTDLLACCGHGAEPCTRAERAAVRAFVEEGGTLLLAAAAGEFEAGSGRPAADLAVAGLAEEFGFGFRSAADLPLDPRHGLRHLRRRELRLTAAGKRLGLSKAQTFLWFPAPIRAPRGATVLLRTRGGEPVFARARVGRGTVAVYGDVALFANAWSSFPAAVHLARLAPRGRRGEGERPPAALDVVREDHACDRFTVRAVPFARHRAGRVLGLATEAWAEMRRGLRFPRPPREVLIRLEPGVGVRAVGWGAERIETVLGADLDDAGTVAKLVEHLAIRLLFAWWGHRAGRLVFFAAAEALSVRVLRRMGFAGAADRLAAVLREGPPVDAAAVYDQVLHRPGAWRRILLDLEDDLGEDLLPRLARALPAKDPFEAFPRAPFTPLDGLACHLGRALGGEAYEALGARGHTVRRLPLTEPGSKEFRAGVDRALRRIAADPAEAFSDRLAAARRLAEGLAGARGLPARARAKDVSRAFPAALALAGARDPRAAEPLARLATHGDAGIAAVAALAAVADLGDRSAADRLVGSIEAADTAFLLAAGRALASIGDPRADRYAFGSLPGCSFRVRENGVRRTFARIDGREVAVVSTGPTWWARGHGGATSACYVYWVHTDEARRRLGISRAAFGKALDSPWARTLAATMLHAMGDYHAHALYREHGLVVSHRYREFDRPSAPRATRAPQGVRIRPAAPADADAVARLSDRVHGARGHPPLEVPDFPGHGVARVAEAGGRLAGAVWFTGDRLFAFAVDDALEPANRREAVGVALLGSAERELSRRGVKRLRGYSWLRYDDAFHRRCLHLAGFASRRDDLRELTRIRDLGVFLAEMEATLAGRAAKADPPLPRTTLSLSGGGLRARLAVEPGRVTVLPRPEGPAGVAVEGSPEAIQRLVLPIGSPFEEYVQAAVAVRPALDSSSRRLLETLFPRTAE